jgi:hypothetical protein
VHLVYLARIKEQFTGTLGFVIIAITVAEFRNVGVDEPNFLTLDLGIALGNRSLAKTQRLNLVPVSAIPASNLSSMKKS